VDVMEESDEEEFKEGLAALTALTQKFLLNRK
jgi:hypothetical protein